MLDLVRIHLDEEHYAVADEQSAIIEISRKRLTCRERRIEGEERRERERERERGEKSVDTWVSPPTCRPHHQNRLMFNMNDFDSQWQKVFGFGVGCPKIPDYGLD